MQTIQNPKNFCTFSHITYNNNQQPSTNPINQSLRSMEYYGTTYPTYVEGTCTTLSKPYSVINNSQRKCCQIDNPTTSQFNSTICSINATCPANYTITTDTGYYGQCKWNGAK